MESAEAEAMAMANATRRTGAPRIFMALANNTHWLLKYLTYNFFWNSDGGFWVLGSGWADAAWGRD